MDRQLENLNVLAHELLATPEQIKVELPTNPDVQTSVASARAAVQAIIHGDDHRLLVVVGPCSIHDVTAAREYAERLIELSREVDDTLLLVHHHEIE